jgi:hypothetical protein
MTHEDKRQLLVKVPMLLRQLIVNNLAPEPLHPFPNTGSRLQDLFTTMKG